MNVLDPLIASLLSPMVLAFLLGIIASLIQSDLKIPKDAYSIMTIYLLFAIGLKGGAKLNGVAFGEFWQPLLAAVFLSLAIPLWSYGILRRFGRLDSINAAALSAHYGSVSAVTFGESIAFLGVVGVVFEPYMAALLAVMEVPAILIAIFLVGRKGLKSSGGGSMKQVMRELITSKSIVLLLGGMAIGLLSGKKGAEQIAPFFDAPFRGVLTLFLLEIGLETGRRLGELRQAGWRLIVFATVMPMLHGLLGVGLGHLCGLSLGGATILGTLAASASYIAAPAAVRVALPSASPAIYLTSSLALTFPFNMIFGIPSYYAFACFLHSW